MLQHAGTVATMGQVGSGWMDCGVGGYGDRWQGLAGLWLLWDSVTVRARDLSGEKKRKHEIWRQLLSPERMRVA